MPRNLFRGRHISGVWHVDDGLDLARTSMYTTRAWHMAHEDNTGDTQLTLAIVQHSSLLLASPQETVEPLMRLHNTIHCTTYTSDDCLISDVVSTFKARFASKDLMDADKLNGNLFHLKWP